MRVAVTPDTSAMLRLAAGQLENAAGLYEQSASVLGAGQEEAGVQLLEAAAATRSMAAGVTQLADQVDAEVKRAQTTPGYVWALTRS